MPEQTPREWIRAAVRIVAATRRDAAPPPTLPLAAWQRVETLERLLNEAQARHWRYARQCCREQLRRALGQLRRELDETDRDLARGAVDRPPTLRDVLDDLAALRREFPAVRVNLRGGSLAVVTESIDLDGVELGPFEIELSWDRRGESSCDYVVRALSPRPAGRDDAVVHPHVRDEELCEGEGAAAIRAALGEGRLLDFFLIVAQTLATYNASSAFVALDEWVAISCADCGGSVADDEGGCCEQCESVLCDDCAYSCTSCGRTACSSCGAPCAACHEHCCQSCLEECFGCQQQFCERCCDEGECSRCRQTADDQEEPEAAADPPPTSLSGDPDHPLRLGEASAPA